MVGFSRWAGNGVRLFLVVCLTSLVGTGCASDKAGVGKTIPVAGKITVDGKPLTTGSVAFMPDTSKGNKSKLEPASIIDGNGSYELFINGQRGAPPGAYKVVVVADEPVDNTNPQPAKSLINAKYKDVKTTPLNIEVKEGAAPGAYDLSLTK